MKMTMRIMTALLLTSQLAVALEDTQYFTLSSNVSSYHHDSERQLSQRPLFAVGVGYHPNEYFAVEYALGYLNTKPWGKSSAQYRRSVIHHTLSSYLTFPHETLSVKPYLLFAVGRSSFGKTGEKRDFHTMYHIGMGAAYTVSDRVALKAEVRSLYTKEAQNSYKDTTFGFGVTMKFGHRSEANASHTPLMSPRSAIEVQSEPSTEGVEIVPDASEVSPTKELARVYFQFDQTVLQEKEYAALEQVGTLLQQDQNRRIVLEGYTDSEGAPRYNVELSRRRAQAVADHLVNTYEIDQARLQVVGKGIGDSFADMIPVEQQRVVIIK